VLPEAWNWKKHQISVEPKHKTMVSVFMFFSNLENMELLSVKEEPVLA
jgi:predicted DNA-binding protein (MmcQ/YjbR family)